MSRRGNTPSKLSGTPTRGRDRSRSPIEDPAARAGPSTSRTPTGHGRRAEPPPRRFDEPFRPRRNVIVDMNPGFWADYCKREENIARRWDLEYGAHFRNEQRSRSMSPRYQPSAEDPELLEQALRKRTNYCVRSGSCIHCHVHPCVCFTITYSGSRDDLNVSNASWERQPAGCLEMLQANGYVSDPGFRVIHYEEDPSLSPLRRNDEEDPFGGHLPPQHPIYHNHTYMRYDDEF